MVAADDPEPYARRDTVEELRQENERLRRAEGHGRSERWRRRWKSIASWVLIVVACVLAALSVFVVFVRNEVLNTDTYVSTVTPLASNPAIQSAVAKRVTDELVTKINVEGRVSVPFRDGPDSWLPRSQQPSRPRRTTSP